VEVLSPGWLAESIRADAGRALAAYGVTVTHNPAK
jgi:hypothetical protein